MASLHAGALLARRYRLIDQIGAGGMSVIWRARDEVLDRVVAVKVLAPALAATEKFRELVREEARAAAQLVHPHVTAVHDYGETVAPDGRITSFVVMELLNGEELEAILTAGPLPWRSAVEVCAQVAEALAAAHRLGIVHRDITPANVMMTPMGAKVLDFGIATHVGAPDEDEDGDTFGTPAYVAPERLDGTPAQPATDTYSLGVLLYQTLTGRVPFPADTWEDLTRTRQENAQPPPLTEVPGLPAAVADVCHRCLARDPAERPTAHQVGVILREQLRTAEALSDPQSPTADPTAASAPVSPAAPGTVTHAAGPDRGALFRSPLRALALATAAAVTLAVAVLSFSPIGGLRSDPRVLPTTANPDEAAPSAPTDDLAGSGDAPQREDDVPSGDSATAQPPPTPPADVASPRPSAAAPTTTLGEAVAQVDQLISEGIASGAIIEHAGVDLRNYLRNLRNSLHNGSPDVPGQVDEMRHKVAIRTNEGSINPGYAGRLDAALERLAAAA